MGGGKAGGGTVAGGAFCFQGRARERACECVLVGVEVIVMGGGTVLRRRGWMEGRRGRTNGVALRGGG